MLHYHDQLLSAQSLMSGHVPCLIKAGMFPGLVAERDNLNEQDDPCESPKHRKPIARVSDRHIY